MYLPTLKSQEPDSILMIPYSITPGKTRLMLSEGHQTVSCLLCLLSVSSTRSSATVPTISWYSSPLSCSSVLVISGYISHKQLKRPRECSRALNISLFAIQRGPYVVWEGRSGVLGKNALGSEVKVTRQPVLPGLL